MTTKLNIDSIRLNKNTKISFIDNTIDFKGDLATLSTSNTYSNTTHYLSNKEVKKSLYSNTKTFLNNLSKNIKGVEISYIKKLTIHGMGYRVINCTNSILEMKLGFSHLITVNIPDNITIVAKDTNILLASSNHHELAKFATKLTRLRTYNKYKKKGIYLEPN